MGKRKGKKLEQPTKNWLFAFLSKHKIESATATMIAALIGAAALWGNSLIQHYLPPQKTEVQTNSQPVNLETTHGDNSPAVTAGNNSPVTINQNLVTKEAKEEELRQAALNSNYKLSLKYPYGYALLGNAEGSTVYFEKYKDIKIICDWNDVQYSLDSVAKKMTIVIPKLDVVIVNTGQTLEIARNRFTLPYTLEKPNAISYVSFGDKMLYVEVIDEDTGIIVIGLK